MTRILGVILIIIIGFIFILTYFHFFTADDNLLQIVAKDDQPGVISFTVEKPYLVIRGNDLDNVEIYGQISGSENNPTILLGVAEKTNSSDTESDRWIFMIPEEPILFEHIFAKSYVDGKVINELPLNISGQVDLYNALWATGQSMLFPLKVGQIGTFENLSLKFNQVIQDSRCPADVTCVWAGDFQVAVTIISNNLEENLEIVDSREPYLFDDYLIDIVPKLLTTTDLSNYVVTFSIIKDVKI